MDLEYRPVTFDEIPDFAHAEARAFGGHASEGYVGHARRTLDPERTLVAFDGGRIVGTSASHAYEITVPGGRLPSAGVAWVTVQPTHRRRGIMTELMTRQLAQVREWGEPLACLWPSESTIYGRFGYGMSAFIETFSLERQHSAFAHAPEHNGRFDFMGRDEAATLFPHVYERVCEQRNGMLRRGETWWDVWFNDPPEIRRGASAYFFVGYTGEGGVLDGYVKYRTDQSQGRLIVHEMMAATAEAHASLWRYCFGVDLMHSVEARRCPEDDALPWMLADPYRLERSRRGALWLRLVDAEAALARRRYAVGGRVVIAIRDALCPWNERRLELEGGPDGATCRETTRSPGLTLDSAALASAYLGATGLGPLQQAGRVDEGTVGTIRALDAMLATPLKPWCAQDF